MRQHPPQGVFAVVPILALSWCLIVDAWTWLIWTTGSFTIATVILEVIRARTERDL